MKQPEVVVLIQLTRIYSVVVGRGGGNREVSTEIEAVDRDGTNVQPEKSCYSYLWAHLLKGTEVEDFIDGRTET